MKTRTRTNNKYTINKNSGPTCLNTIPFTNNSFASELSYTDINNNHPTVDTIIHVKDIVFLRKDLTTDKWLIISPNPPVAEFIAEVSNILRTWSKCNIYVIIQSEDSIREQRDIMDNKKRELKDQCQLRMNNYKYTDQTEITNISPKLIVAKYQTLKEFQDDKKNWTEYPNNRPYYFKKPGNLDGAEKTIVEHYKPNDEIWHYSEWSTNIDLLFSARKELFFLIRNGKIVCSPIVDSCT